MAFARDVVIVGGCGHVGLPLGLAFADRGLKVTLYDVNQAAVDRVLSGTMPFDEPGAPEAMARVLPTGNLDASTDPAVVGQAEHVVVIIGTPVDEHLNPSLHVLPDAIKEFSDHLTAGQLMILRSTVYPGVTRMVEGLMKDLGKDIDVAFCPERIAEGKAMTELYELPQIVGARDQRVTDRASKLFRSLTAEVLEVVPEEAELAKLFTNSWRYVKFATANQFYMIANDFGLDFEKIRSTLSFNYPRATDLPRAGLAAGPCLFKDTAQLAAFNNNGFTLGNASMMVNEGLPLYIVSKMEAKYDLANSTVGILGMAFKADSDDARSSLSYKLKRILRFKAREVLTSDPYVTTDPDLSPLDVVLEKADILVVGAPHTPYKSLAPQVPTIDIWDVFGNGVRV
jgi:UDP-N-acetyl-D-mannosaminuronic acid dehydrogenase